MGNVRSALFILYKIVTFTGNASECGFLSPSTLNQLSPHSRAVIFHFCRTATPKEVGIGVRDRQPPWTKTPQNFTVHTWNSEVYLSINVSQFIICLWSSFRARNVFDYSVQFYHYFCIKGLPASSITSLLKMYSLFSSLLFHYTCPYQPSYSSVFVFLVFSSLSVFLFLFLYFFFYWKSWNGENSIIYGYYTRIVMM